MDITTAFAFRVRDLHRRGLTAGRIAHRLGVSLEEVIEAHRAMALPLKDAMELDAERAAERDPMPKKMAERQRKAEIGGKRR